MLPAQYCKLHNIKPGDPIDLYVVEGEQGYLLILPRKEVTQP